MKSQNMIRTGKEEEKEDNDMHILSGDNTANVDIEPDVKANHLYLQICACSFVLNCFTKDSVAKSSD
uniref:Uncharacterized protein n=1 Tax=viral metagenome TaxID=1070528 RepID=A0A6C0E373_9ZZZZ